MSVSGAQWSVAVLGGGTMGIGIAYVCAMAGGPVHLIEPDERRRVTMMTEVDGALASAKSRGKLTEQQAADLRGRIQLLDAVEQIPRNLDLVIESVPERSALKQDVLARAALREPRILASNTSAISIDLLAEGLPDPARFLGMHFFNPVWAIKLVEIVRGKATTDGTVQRAADFAEWIGKQSLIVRDVPGFATSRLDLIASLEAMRMLESGVASAEDIDRAAVVAYRHPVGPLRLSDIVGLDVRLDIAKTLAAAHGDRFAPPAILERMVGEGKLGAKSGEGFFIWPDQAA